MGLMWEGLNGSMELRLAGRFEPLAMAGLVERDGGFVRLASNRLAVSNEVFVALMG